MIVETQSLSYVATGSENFEKAIRADI